MVKKAKKADEESWAMIEGELGSQKILSAKRYLSTGSTLLDYALANKKDGGVPVGRITEICGNEASGKSLLAYHIMANTQKEDGLAIYIDIERAADEPFMKRMGVDVNKNFIYPKPIPKSIEEVFQYVENVIKVVRSRFPEKEKLVTVVWDSVAATSAQETTEEDYGGGRITPEARAMSQCFRRSMEALDMGYVTFICVNQLRKKIGVSFGDDEVTPHGKALPFYASARIKLKSIGKIKENSNPKSRIIGVKCRSEVIKNRMAPPHRKVEFPIFFDWGVGDEISWIDYLKDLGYITMKGAWGKFKIDGEEYSYQGTAGWKKDIVSKPGMQDKILKLIHDEMIIKFDKRPDDVVVEDAIMSGGDK